MFFSEDVDLRHKLLNLLWQLKLINFRFTISPMLPLLYWSIFDNNKSSRERKLNIFTAIWIACEYSHLSSFVHHLSQKTKQAQLLKVLSVILKLQTGWISKEFVSIGVGLNGFQLCLCWRLIFPFISCTDFFFLLGSEACQNGLMAHLDKVFSDSQSLIIFRFETCQLVLRKVEYADKYA